MTSETESTKLATLNDGDAGSRAKAPAPGLSAAKTLLHILEQRASQYGGFHYDAACAAEMCMKLFNLRLAAPQVCKVLLCLKLGRIAAATRQEEGLCTEDTLLDLAGYACILADIMFDKDN